MRRTVCKKAGCNRLATPPHKFCEQHLYLERAEEEKRAAFFGNKQYASQWQELYNSTQWHNMSQLQLKNHPYCAICGDKATQVDHIQPHRGNLDLFFNEDNLQSLCQHCHTLKTKREIADRQRERVRDYQMRKRHGLLGENYESV